MTRGDSAIYLVRYYASFLHCVSDTMKKLHRLTFAWQIDLAVGA